MPTATRQDIGAEPTHAYSQIPAPSDPLAIRQCDRSPLGENHTERSLDIPVAVDELVPHRGPSVAPQDPYRCRPRVPDPGQEACALGVG